MTIRTNYQVGEILIDENDTHATPPSGQVSFYAKTDGLLYSKDDAGAETQLGGGGSPGGATTQIQFNNAGAFGGDADFTWTLASNVLQLGSVATPAIIRSPDGSASAGANLSITAGAGIGTDQAGGNVTITAGARTGTGTAGVINLVIPATGALQINSAAGTSGQVLTSQGATTAPIWTTAAGSGDVVKVGTPVDNQIGVWTGDGTIEGDADLTYDGSDGTMYVNSTDGVTGSISVATPGNIGIFGAANTTAASAGGSITIQGGTGNTIGGGGTMTITGGTGGDGGTGGVMTITGGAGGGTTSAGGAMFIDGGNGGSSGGGGGLVRIRGGAANGGFNAGNVSLGRGSTSASRTGDMMYIPTSGGAPTGAPATISGLVPLIYDATNHRLYVRSGGTWRSVALA